MSAAGRPASASPQSSGSPTGAIASVRWTLIAAAVGAWAPAAVVRPPQYSTWAATAALCVGALLVSLSLRLVTRPAAVQLGALVVAAGLLGAASVPLVGRAPYLVTLVLVLAAHSAFVGWRPVAWSRRRGVAHGWLAAPLVVAASVVWFVAQSAVGTVVVAAAAVAVAELTLGRTELLARVDDAVRTAGAAALRSTGVDVAWRYLGRSRRATRSAFPLSPRNRWFSAAIVVGFALRCVWAVTMTVDRAEFYSEWNLRIARQFAAGGTPRFGGFHTAYWPPGYGAALAPLAWLERQVPWFDLHMTASALNVVLGTVTIALAALLADRWLGPAARNPAAWLMAVAAGHVYATSAAVGETLATTLFLLVVLAVTEVVDRARPGALGAFVTVGVLVGATALVKDVAILLVGLPLLVGRARGLRWRSGLRPAAAVMAGACVVLLPWGARNAVQVGVYSPFSTVTGEGLCFTKYRVDALRYELDGPESTMTPELLLDCYRNSPLDNADAPNPYLENLPDVAFDRPDEAAWNRRMIREFVSWVVRNPGYIPSQIPLRVYTTAGNDAQGGLTLATQSGEATIAGPLAMLVYEDLAQLWYYGVLCLAALALARLPDARRALPFWVIPLFVILYTIPGPRSLSRHFFVAYPFLAVLAAGAIAAISASDLGRRRAPPESEPDRSMGRTSRRG